MAFVTALPIPNSTRATPALGAQLASTPVRESKPASATSSKNSVRMGYGAYSYLTDKTKGHTNQYYVDKFRIAADFIKGSPASDADAKLGRDAKGAVLVPKEGIPQILDDPIPPRDTSVDPDPRVAESEGQVYKWDINYVDPKFLPSTYADLDDEHTSEMAFAHFRESVNLSRGSSITAMNFGAAARAQRIKAGLDESYMLSFDGMLDCRYARLQKISDPATFTPTGSPQTEIPGTPYLSSVGAMDLIEQDEVSVASFWKDAVPKPLTMPYKRPSGNATPDLPYNVAPSVEVLKEAQEAHGLLPPSSD